MKTPAANERWQKNSAETWEAMQTMLDAIIDAIASIPHPDDLGEAECLEKAYRAAEVAADMSAESVRSIKAMVNEAYERGLEDAARVAEVKPRKGGRPLSGPHHAGIRRGRSEAARLIRALKSNDTNGGHQ